MRVSALAAAMALAVTAALPLGASTAATALATAKSQPMVPEVMRNIAGSMIGEASQKAMTAPSGAPVRPS